MKSLLALTELAGALWFGPRASLLSCAGSVELRGRGRGGRARCCAEPLITLPPRSDTKFYEEFAVLGRSAEAVHKRLYVIFPDGMIEAKIREKMRASLKDWRPEAAGTDAMVVVDPSPAAPVSSGKRIEGHGLTATFSGKRSNPPGKDVGTCDAVFTAVPASKLQGSVDRRSPGEGQDNNTGSGSGDSDTRVPLENVLSRIPP